MEFTRAGMRKAQFKSTSTASSLKLREKDLARQRGSRMQQFSAKRIKFDGISGDMVPTADLAEALKKIQVYFLSNYDNGSTKSGDCRLMILFSPTKLQAT